MNRFKYSFGEILAFLLFFLSLSDSGTDRVLYTFTIIEYI